MSTIDEKSINTPFPNLKIKRTNAGDKYFKDLIVALDAELASEYSNQVTFYTQYNNVEDIKHVVIAYENDLPVACGAMKKYNDDTVEIKRMYTKKECRGKGAASLILIGLEAWALELAFKSAILETGTRQFNAIRLYEKKGFAQIPNYGQYKGAVNSICFKKELIPELSA